MPLQLTLPDTPFPAMSYNRRLRWARTSAGLRQLVQDGRFLWPHPSPKAIGVSTNPAGAAETTPSGSVGLGQLIRNVTGFCGHITSLRDRSVHESGKRSTQPRVHGAFLHQLVWAN